MPKTKDEVVRTSMKFNGQEIYLMSKGLQSILDQYSSDSRIWPLLDKLSVAQSRILKKYQEIGQASNDLAITTGGGD